MLRPSLRLTINVSILSDCADTPSDFIKEFSWDDPKFPRSKGLMKIAEIIQSRVKSIDADIKQFMEDYGEVAGTLSTLVKNKGANFMTADMSEVIYQAVDEGRVEASIFIRDDSTFLTNMLVVVPERKEREFLQNYVFEDEKNDTASVPGSAHFTGLQDAEGNKIFRVALFHKFPEFNRPRTIGNFTCKQFEYNKEQYEKDQERIIELTKEKKELGEKLLRRCHLTYSELFICCIHLKIMRVYIDGILRFGIPPTFTISILETHGEERKIFKNMTEVLIADASEREMYGSKDEI